MQKKSPSVLATCLTYVAVPPTVFLLLLLLWASPAHSGTQSPTSPSWLSRIFQSAHEELSPPENTKSANPCYKNCKTSGEAVALIKNFEGFSPFIYLDSADVPTIGFGHAIRPGEKFREPMTGIEARDLLAKDIAKREPQLNKLVATKLYPYQYDALMSFMYNLGSGTLAKSSVLNRVNSNQHTKVPERLLLYNKAGGQVLRGLTLRRTLEGRLYAR
jgi:lysozyme